MGEGMAGGARSALCHERVGDREHIGPPDAGKALVPPRLKERRRHVPARLGGCARLVLVVAVGGEEAFEGVGKSPCPSLLNRLRVLPAFKRGQGVGRHAASLRERQGRIAAERPPARLPLVAVEQHEGFDALRGDADAETGDGAIPDFSLSGGGQSGALDARVGETRFRGHGEKSGDWWSDWKSSEVAS